MQKEIVMMSILSKVIHIGPVKVQFTLEKPTKVDLLCKQADLLQDMYVFLLIFKVWKNALLFELKMRSDWISQKFRNEKNIGLNNKYRPIYCKFCNFSEWDTSKLTKCVLVALRSVFWSFSDPMSLYPWPQNFRTYV